jgi:DNA repair protein RadD
MELRDYQREAVAATWADLTGRPGAPLIVMPTGSGKSLVIAALAADAVMKYQGRVIVVAHRRELLSQNADKIQRLLPWVRVGMFSAGLRRRDADAEIVCAGIQSCYKKAVNFGARHLVIVDESHLVPSDGEGMYRTFLDGMRAANPRLRLVGLTATPFRTGEGNLCGEDKLFQRVAYTARVKPLIDAGYLCNLTSVPTVKQVDTSGLKIRGGEYIAGEVERLFDVSEVTRAAVAEIVAKSAGRRSVLIFAAGVQHAGHVAEEVASVTGERCGVVTGETTDLERRATLENFQAGRLRWLVNVDVLTTGYDAPNIDCIAVLRATQSPGLFAQICGRGFRVHPDKTNCLVLDFGGNVERHGPLDADDYGLRKTSDGRGTGEAPTKVCPNCQAECGLSARECECGWLFPREEGPRHDETAGEQELLQANEPPQTWQVEGVTAEKWTNKKTGSVTLRVNYECTPTSGGNLREMISEWVCLEHDGWAGVKANKWWRERCNYQLPTINEAVGLFRLGAVALPRSITAKREGRFWRILNYELEEAANPDAQPWDAAESEATPLDSLAVVDDESDMPF